VHILVTGAAGYIGSIVAEQAVAAGHAVTTIDNLSGGSRSAVPPESVFIEGDFGDHAVLDAAFGGPRVDAVVHLAAEAAIAPSITDPARYFDANLVKGLALLDAMRRYRVSRLIFSSTAATYGEPEQLPITEDHPHRPINAYGESKYLFERCLGWYHRAYGISAVVFRYFNAAGASVLRGEDRREESHLIPLALDVVLGRREALDIFGADYPTRDGSCLRDYVHVVDIADAHLRAIAAVDAIGLGCFNIGSGTGHTVLEVIEAVRRVTGHPVPVRARPRRPGDPAALVASAERAFDALGWRPSRPSLEEIVGSAWHWRRTHPHGYRNGHH
jgi:UDP-glucose 4-epimerase